ncbi:pilus assembly protein CpaE [Amnibacterium flavum]|uniref:Pilus assembly protein CpaE n=1 Tax=Amnibacterium flavum TaxID=2173173 RepID=A0A2V1HP98_9MICO|nr:pilus assembly protein CpaE [Amnibacterium flavum]PVZ93432.1 pilus assembly protein CpaE [Amnibacterium flavum]
MISIPLARALRTAGLRWKPVSGDRFVLDETEAEDAVFTVSDMTIEAHSYPTGTILGFNGTTEWALDSVSLDDALWLPSEAQLRELLRGAFRALRADGAGDEATFSVDIDFRGETATFSAASASDAYGEAVLHLVGAATLR